MPVQLGADVVVELDPLRVEREVVFLFDSREALEEEDVVVSVTRVSDAPNEGAELRVEWEEQRAVVHGPRGAGVGTGDVSRGTGACRRKDRMGERSTCEGAADL